MVVCCWHFKGSYCSEWNKICSFKKWSNKSFLARNLVLQYSLSLKPLSEYIIGMHYSSLRIACLFSFFFNSTSPYIFSVIMGQLDLRVHLKPVGARPSRVDPFFRVGDRGGTMPFEVVREWSYFCALSKVLVIYIAKSGYAWKRPVMIDNLIDRMLNNLVYRL